MLKTEPLQFFCLIPNNEIKIGACRGRHFVLQPSRWAPEADPQPSAKQAENHDEENPEGEPFGTD